MVKKFRRYKPGSEQSFSFDVQLTDNPTTAVAIRDIMRNRRSIDSLILKAPIQRMIRELMAETSLRDVRIQRVALEAVQEATEAFIVSLFKGELFQLL